MRKRILSLILVATMMASIFTGCGKGGDSNSNATPTQGATAEEGLWADYKIDLTKNLSNPNATDKAQAVYNWLCSIEGKYIISGQQEKCADTSNEEFTYIKGITEELPGLRGLDFINGDYEGVVRRSETWDKFNCLISICWHMGVPGDVDGGYESSKGTYAGLAEALEDPNSDGYKQIIADMDLAAEALKDLQEKGIVVLWRPFHEFDGKWFWWGKGGDAAFVKLWQIMYDRYTNYHGLNNLIWVLGYTGNASCGATGWYPGDEYVDIIAADSYSNTAAENGYKSMYNILEERLGDSNKPFALHECGKLPKINELKANEIKWLWFLVWHSEYIDNEDINNLANLSHTYTNEYVLTMDEMPDFDALMGVSEE